MIRCTPERLESYLKDYGWTFCRLGKTDWATGFQGEKRSYPLRLVICDTWISFQVRPFMKLPINWQLWPELARYILELNIHCRLAKLGLDSEGQLSLSLDVLASNFDFESFSNIIGIIGYYCDEVYDELVHYLDIIGFNKVEAKLLT